jgi:hypothetical protein
MIENRSYESYNTMEGDDAFYTVGGFNPDQLLPDEDVYKPKKVPSKKKKVPSKKKNGLEKFMDKE